VELPRAYRLVSMEGHQNRRLKQAIRFHGAPPPERSLIKPPSLNQPTAAAVG